MIQHGRDNNQIKVISFAPILCRNEIEGFRTGVSYSYYHDSERQGKLVLRLDLIGSD